MPGTAEYARRQRHDEGEAESENEHDSLFEGSMGMDEDEIDDFAQTGPGMYDIPP